MRNRIARSARLLATVFTVAAVAAASLSFVNSAQADPFANGALVAVGSDTTQDVLNGLSGYSEGVFYEPVNSGAPNYQTINSYNATGNPQCITVQIGGPAFFRPNGSSNGRQAMARSYDSLDSTWTGFVNGNEPCGSGGVSVLNQITFARSSSGSGDPGNTETTYIPFARDALTFAYYRPNGTPVTDLTRAELISIFTSTAGNLVTIDGVTMVPCGIQTGSGTFKSWNGTLGITEAQEAAAHNALCEELGDPGDAGGVDAGRVQEHSGDDLKARGDALAGGNADYQIVAGFSASQFIAQNNGASIDRTPPEINLGDISDNGAGANLGNPVTGTAPNLGPVSAFYEDTTFGRDVYNVFPTQIIDLPNVFPDIAAMFVGSNSSICTGQAATTVATFGFLSPNNCGSTVLTGPFLSGNS
jgi:hypothetical protein